uniref:Bardet-Biedl syndrome 5 protein homolog n=1 Tax=Panagrellus redivivus TaxID=6233 RepID=A0A7E5A161_PANRE
MGRKDRSALSDITWHDREIFFDMDQKAMKLIPGEVLVEKIDGVEDTKGNNGDNGTLRITNLRLLWNANQMPRINLTIGWNCVTGATTRFAKSKLKGRTESLFLMAKTSSTRFEFVFTCVNKSPQTQIKLFTTVIGLHRAYETSKLYRDMKMRGSLIDENDRLRILPMEQQCERFEGTWNLSSDQGGGNLQGNLGVLITTNIRIVWYASMTNSHNVSIPYMQLRSCRVRDSRFGFALVIETSVHSGEYILGFRIDPEDRLEAACKTIQALHAAYLASPIFGVQHKKEFQPAIQEEIVSVEKATDADEVETEEEQGPARIDAFAAYFSDGVEGGDKRPIEYSEELGVAIEQMKANFTIKELWAIHND